MAVNSFLAENSISKIGWLNNCWNRWLTTALKNYGTKTATSILQKLYTTWQQLCKCFLTIKI